MFAKSLSSLVLINKSSSGFRNIKSSVQQFCCYSTQVVKPATPIKLFKVTNEATNTDELFAANGKVIVFGVPGAFTPVCSNKHIPSYINNLKQLKEKGISKVICVSVNDSFVMKAWKEKVAPDVDIEFIADPFGEFTRQVGLEIDLTAAGLGKRCKRYAMLVENGTVKQLFVEESPGQLEKTTAENMLTLL